MLLSVPTCKRTGSIADGQGPASEDIRVQQTESRANHASTARAHLASPWRYLPALFVVAVGVASTLWAATAGRSSYWALILGGVTFIHLFPSGTMLVVGICCIPVGVVIGTAGTVKWRKMTRSIEGTRAKDRAARGESS